MRFWFWPFLINTDLCVFVKKWHSEQLINENETEQFQYSLSNQCREILHSQLYMSRETPCCPHHPKQADFENVASLRMFNSYVLVPYLVM